MATIYILNKLINKFHPSLLVKATSNESIMIGGISKFLIENYLLKNEFALYTFMFGLPTFNMLTNTHILPIPDIPVTSGILLSLFAYGTYLSSPLIAGFRTYKAIKNYNIHIINLT